MTFKPSAAHCETRALKGQRVNYFPPARPSFHEAKSLTGCWWLMWGPQVLSKFCPSPENVQFMSRFCPNYVQILSLSNYCLWFVLHVQELSSPNPAFVHNASSRSRLCPSIVLILDPNPRQNHRAKSRQNLNSLIFKSTTWSHCSWTKLGQFLDFVVDL